MLSNLIANCLFFLLGQNSFDFATIGATSKIAAMMLTYPYQAIFFPG